MPAGFHHVVIPPRKPQNKQGERKENLAMFRGFLLLISILSHMFYSIFFSLIFPLTRSPSRGPEEQRKPIQYQLVCGFYILVGALTSKIWLDFYKKKKNLLKNVL